MTLFGHQIKKWHVTLVLVLILFFPIPTELVPEWRMQFRDKSGQVLSEVVVGESWNSYTYFATEGYDQRCTDKEGVVVFPKRYLWSGLFSRVVSPILADAVTLAHGSTGTDARIQVFDANYISDNYYWRDEMSLYEHQPSPLPAEGTADKVNRDDIPTCSSLR